MKKIDAVVRTTQIRAIEVLREQLTAKLGRKIDRREAVDVAVLHTVRALHAGLPIAPDIPETTFRRPGGRQKRVHAKVGKQVPR